MSFSDAADHPVLPRLISSWFLSNLTKQRADLLRRSSDTRGSPFGFGAGLLCCASFLFGSPLVRPCGRDVLTAGGSLAIAS